MNFDEFDGSSNAEDENNDNDDEIVDENDNDENEIINDVNINGKNNEPIIPHSALSMFLGTDDIKEGNEDSFNDNLVDDESLKESPQKESLKDNGKLPWVEKYRPVSLDELIDHKEKIDTIRNFIKNNEFPHLLLYGPPGTGKTSLIQAAAREMYGKDYRLYILELNASDHRGIETIRSKIPNFVRTKCDKIRLVILDEADAMTSEAQGALRRTMEKYIKICRFCIICNKVNKIIPGLQSRTSQMRFGMLDPKSIEPRIKDIALKENVEITDNAIKALIDLQKDFRQIINTLQCLHYVRFGDANGGKYPAITEEFIYKYLGKPSKQEIMNLVHDILSKPFTEIYEKMQLIYRDNKWNPVDLIQRINNFVIDCTSFSEEQKAYLTQKFSRLENMIVNGRDTEIQLAALIGILKKSLIKYK